jgi:dTMP kinase
MQGSKFITFEGGEGSGKSTQVKLLAEHFRALGKEVIVTREPGGTVGAEKIREILLSHKYSATEEVLLNFAARLDHVENLIKPALARGAVVICDRFFDSTYVYQGYAKGLEIGFIDKIRELTLGSFSPDITLVLDIDPVEGLARAKSRGNSNHYDEMELGFHQQIRNGFLKIAESNPARCKVVDAGQDADNVAKAINSIIGS